MQKVRAKFQVNQVTEFSCGGQEVKMNAVYEELSNEGNNSFAQATPHGELTITVDNPACKGFYVPGKEYYLDFIPADNVREM